MYQIVSKRFVTAIACYHRNAYSIWDYENKFSYHTVNFRQDINISHHIAHPQEARIVCVLKVQILIYFLNLFLLWVITYHITLGRIIKETISPCRSLFSYQLFPIKITNNIDPNRLPILCPKCHSIQRSHKRERPRRKTCVSLVIKKCHYTIFGDYIDIKISYNCPVYPCIFVPQNRYLGHA